MASWSQDGAKAPIVTHASATGLLATFRCVAAAPLVLGLRAFAPPLQLPVPTVLQYGRRAAGLSILTTARVVNCDLWGLVVLNEVR
jgi:hypothetical protein